MKYLALVLFLVLAPMAVMAASQEAAPQLPPDFLNLPDFLSNDTVPLTQREKKADSCLGRAWPRTGSLSFREAGLCAWRILADDFGQPHAGL